MWCRSQAHHPRAVDRPRLRLRDGHPARAGDQKECRFDQHRLRSGLRPRPRGGVRPVAAGRRPRARPAAHPRGRAGRAPRLLLRRRPERRRARPSDPRLLPRHGADPPHRRRGDRAAAPGRARPLGPAARPGGGADRLRPRAAPAGLRLPDLPRARRRLLPRASTRSACSACSAASTRAAGTRTRTTSTCTRSSSARRRCTRPATRWASSATATVGTGDPDRDAAVIAYFGDGATSQGDVNEAFIFAASLQRARSSSSARTTSGRSPSRSSGRPASRSTSGPPGFGFPGVRVDGNDVLARPRGHPAALPARARRAGADLDRGVHLPDGRAHHLRRPDPLPDRRDEVEPWQLKDPIERVEVYLTRSGCADEEFFAEVDGRGRATSAQHLRERLPGDARPRAADHLRPRLRRAARPTSSREQRDEFAGLPRRPFDGEAAH